MCGLTGIWHPGEDPRLLCEEIGRMSGTLAHRGPDDHGTYFDERAGFALGFRRLAIIDLTPAGHQPMSSADGRFVIAFNGEIYNFRELRRELAGGGVEFRGHSDTEVIVEAWARWGGSAVVNRLWGMFALAVWDRAERTLTLARDRLGKKPLYWAETSSAFLFGSELKALIAHPKFSREIDREALLSYLRFGYVPGDLSIFRCARKLAAGTLLERRAEGRLDIRPYWRATDVAREGLRSRRPVGDREAADQLDQLLGDAVERRMISDVPLGVLLSGGIDSSVVAALMQARSPRPIRTFTIGFNVPEYDEAYAARKVAEHLGTEHAELYVTPEDALAVVPSLPDLWDEPFADPSQIPTHLVCALARRHVTVALSGDGGDEVFGGYTRYAWAERIWRLQNSFPRVACRAGAWLLGHGSVAAWDRVYSAVSWALPSAWRVSLPGVKVRKMAALLNVETEDALYRRLVSLWDSPSELVSGAGERSSASLEAELLQATPEFTDRMMLRDLVTYLPDDILVKVDRASMGASLEARAPLLDHRIVEWAWRLPMSLKRRGGVGKWILREVLHRYVPPPLVDRPKTGFGVPIDRWLRGPLREWAEDLLSESSLREGALLEPGPVRRSWEAHLSGRANEEYRLWAVLMLQAWRRRWKA